MKLSTRSSRLLALTVLSFLLVCLMGQIERAKAQGFTNAQFKGRYAVSLTFGANNGAGIGVVEADGNGVLRNGSLVLHVPGATEPEAVSHAQLQGQYAVNSNGTATLMARISLPNRVLDRTFDLIVRGTDGFGVIGLFGAMREKSDFVTGVGVTIELRRLPEKGQFDNASLDAAFAFELGFESQAAVGFGIVTADGAGHLVNGALLLNVPGPDGGRQVLRGQVGGTYTVNSDGMVTMDLTLSFQNGPFVKGTFDLMITDEQPSGNAIDDANQRRPRMARSLMGSPRGFFDIFVGDLSKMLQPMPRRRVNQIVFDTSISFQ